MKTKKSRSQKAKKATGTAIAKVSSQALATAQTAPMTILEIISHAARDPDTDVDKLERLIAMAERTRAKDAEQAFGAAMASAQGELGRVSADATNPQTRSKYASYAALDRAVRPVYTRHGFALSFDTSPDTVPDHVRVLCHVSHKAGHTRTYQADMPADGKGAKGGDVMTKTHAAGAAMSYGSRYLLKMIFNVAVGEDDKDGNAGEISGVLDESQVEHVFTLIQRVGADRDKFVQFMGVESVPDILAKDYEKAIKALNLKATAAAKKTETVQ